MPTAFFPCFSGVSEMYPNRNEGTHGRQIAKCNVMGPHTGYPILGTPKTSLGVTSAIV
jgi:hypothetical protein